MRKVFTGREHGRLELAFVGLLGLDKPVVLSSVLDLFMAF